MSDDDDGWATLVGPPQFESSNEKRLSEFFFAAQEGDLDKLQQMLDSKLIKDINSCSPQKRETVLHYACKGTSLDVVKFLVEKGVHVNLKDTRLKHGLLVASAHGHLDIVKYLVGHNSDMTVVDKYGRSSLHWAITYDHYDVAVHLLNAGAPVFYKASSNWQPIHEAAKYGRVRILQMLIEKGADVNVTLGENFNLKQVSPLHIAARDGHIDCLKVLLNHKAAVNVRNAGNQTPLHEAAYRGSKECCKELILRGADPHAKNNLGRTPLLDACNQGHLICAIHLLDAGSFVNHRDFVRKTSLCHLLKQHGTSVFSEDNNQKKLSLDKLASFTDILLQYGANPNSENDDEETPYSLANSMQDKDVLDVINTALDKPRSLLLISKIAIRKIIRCNDDQVWTFAIPKKLQIYLLQNTSYFTGW